ncbi:MAG: family 16 glycosylhydrolase [Prevotellaceae bacterium]|jgi:beta-glucanase (GH16 family)|nr:family 16 glycosylhydrolase [Prevotellaceae bacterium]
MAGFFKQLFFRLSGGIPSMAKYEARVASRKGQKEVAHWELGFEEDFASLDKSRWATHPSVVHGAPTMLYSAIAENHVYTDGLNVAVHDGMLAISTKREAAQGLGFSPRVGFAPVERDYTSGTVNSAPSHVQRYGKVEVKFRFSQASKHLYHALWLGSGKQQPHVNMLRVGHKLELSAFANGRRQVDTWSRRLLAPNTDYVVSLEWSKRSMTWRINGAKLFSAANIVNEPMHIAFSSGVIGNPTIDEPATLEVAWVKAYKYRS